jgi:uncharacterized membrane-anchored protein
MWQMFCKWAGKHAAAEPTLQEILVIEAELLNRDTINRELKLIDDRHKIEANQEKARYLLSKIGKP